MAAEFPNFSNETQRYKIYYMLKIILFTFIIYLSGCVSPQKAMQVLDRNPEKAAEYCVNKFPPKDSVVIENSIIFDTLYVGDVVFDTTFVVLNDTVERTITKTVPKIVTKTVTQTKEVYRENTARVKDLQYKLNEAEKDKAVLKDKLVNSEADRDKWKKLAKKRWWWLLLVIGAAAGWTFRKPLKLLVGKFFGGI